MHIAILGATSQIAKDFVLSFSAKSKNVLTLYARRPEVVKQWLSNVGLSDRFAVADFASFGAKEQFTAILNFVGIGDPAQGAAMGTSIFDVTYKFDEMAVNYVRQHPSCRYIFLSSGAAYGSSFDAPVDVSTKATIAINNLQPQDWYAVAKIYAECRHRALSHLPIVDIRVFNYFSHTQDISARYLITDILRAIQSKTVLKTSPDYIVRDFLNPADFYDLVRLILAAPAINTVVDCYTRAPIDKPTLLAVMQEKFKLKYSLMEVDPGVNATGRKPYYYSLNKRSADFGFQPAFTSLEGVIQEVEKFFILYPDEYLRE
jgi:nucleoside-diphosphate-sugar epimerase